jgi:hypothetical protein
MEEMIRMKKTLGRMLSLLLCVCLLVGALCPAADAAFGGPYTTIGDVKFYGGKMLDRIDLSALVRDGDTLAEGALFLCRIYDEPAAAIASYNYDRIANMEFICEKTGVAELSDYPGAAAPIEPGTYVLFSPRGNLFDDVPFYTFTAKEYYQNASPDAGGLAPARVGLPAFSGIRVTEAEGETVYTMQMTLDPELVAFYDAVNPDGEIEIACKFGYSADDTFATIAARPAAYDASSGLLTIELLAADGTVGAHLHNFRLDADDYGYVFQFTFFSGLFTCGAARSAHAFVQISGRVIEGMPQRVFTQDELAGRLLTRLSGKLWSEKRARRRAAFLLLLPLSAPICIRLAQAYLRSARAFDGNTVDVERAALREALRRIWG